jgi:hypothetical protein
MKKTILLATLLLAAAGYAFFQTASTSPKLATLMPTGALLYLEAPDFSRLLRDWDTSKVKADWLQSANYAVFSRSNLFTKLQEVYGQYGAAAGFEPGLKSVIQIAGSNSALALYGIRDVEFLYISRIADAAFMKSQLWAVREKFEQRQAGGLPFYLHVDPASKRTVAFAFAKGYLLLATRDDLVAQALERIAGAGNRGIDSDRWYHDATAAAPNPGELRLVMNLEALVRSVYFRSYWIQRNASVLRQYWAGVADLNRTGGNIVESRVFLRAPDAAAASSATVSNLLALVPSEAGLYKASGLGEPSETAAFIVQKLIGLQPQSARDWREAPSAVSPDSTAGAEGDLETRIDEQPLPSGAGISDSVAAARAMLEKSGARALLLVQSSSPAPATFVRMPSVIVLDAARDWDRDSVRDSLTAAAGTLWTTSQLGAGWISDTSGRHPFERLDGLGTLLFVNRGRLLFLGNDSALLTAMLDRIEDPIDRDITGAGSPAVALSYAAGFRHLRERPSYQRVMAALDFTAPAENAAPAFFSGNIGSLSRVLSKVSEIRVTERQRPASTISTVLYQAQ